MNVSQPTPRQRRAHALRHRAGLTVRQVAERMKISYGHAQNLLVACERRLRNKLSESKTTT